MPGRLEHIQQSHASNRPDIAHSRGQKASGEKSQGEAYRVGKEGENQLKGLTITGQEQCSDKLGENHAQNDSQAKSQKADTEGFGEEEPSDGFTLHSQDSLDSQGGLLLAKHIPVNIADKKPQQKRHATHGHLHSITESR